MRLNGKRNIDSEQGHAHVPLWRDRSALAGHTPCGLLPQRWLRLPVLYRDQSMGKTPLSPFKRRMKILQNCDCGRKGLQLSVFHSAPGRHASHLEPSQAECAARDLSPVTGRDGQNGSRSRIGREVDLAHRRFDDRIMYHYDPDIALEELTEDAVLPNPSLLRDMIVRAALSPERVLEINRQFQAYLHGFGELQKTVRPILEELTRAKNARVHGS
jgi:hypothetical protein